MKLITLTSPEVAAAAPRSIAVLPLGAIEQHGPHLAVSTDTAIVTRLAEAAEAARAAQLVLCPTLPFGASHHHLGFAGTLSLSHRLYADAVVELVESLLASGFRRVVLLNGHGGNITPVRQALAALSHAHRAEPDLLIALAVYWELAGQAFAGEPPLASPALSHACEYETSLMLHLFPERVHLERARRAQRPPANGYIPWEDEHPARGITMVKPTHTISSNGSSGEPALATPAKGEHLFQRALAALLDFLDAFATWPPMKELTP
jgi:creatinine amidohydrolase